MPAGFCPSGTVDVIIPLYNVELFIEKAIASVQAQTYPVARIIVVNDGSTDGGPARVEAMAEHDSRITLLSGPNVGLSGARNKGVLASTGEFVAFLDSDDVWHPEKLQLQMGLLQKSQELAFVHCGVNFIDEHDAPTQGGGEQLPQGQATFDSVRLGTYAVTGSASAVVARREMCIAVGLFDTAFTFGGEDADMWVRLAALGAVACVPVPLVFIRINRQSLQRSMSAATRAKSRVVSRMMVAEKWKDDAAFVAQSLPILRQEVWAVMRWYLLAPKELMAFYDELKTSPYALGKLLFANKIAYIAFAYRKMMQTVFTVLCSPKEGLRLFKRLVQEKWRIR
ncbi:glycosyltransferase family 2 protein [Desulfovibrio cuneatus]|uniref:glycosyltransferase family 2 protein n=1 Tax=Desulfovibrio cuneatus TaxID=159728 RepID=UPI00040E46CA|nr:glycosyltransferase family A protein [Desulfovibrio cuneatus]